MIPVHHAYSSGPAEGLADLSQRDPQRLDLVGRQGIEHRPAHALDVSGRRGLEHVEPGVREYAEHAPAVVRARLAVHVAALLHTSHGMRDAAAGAEHAVRELGHPQPPVGRLGEGDEDLVLGQRHPALVRELPVHLLRHQPGDVEERAPDALLLGRQPPDPGLRFGRHRRSHSATSAAQYVRMIEAPARRIEVRVSSTVRSRSIQPRAAAASTMAYSPDTWYAPTGTSTAAATAATTSRYPSAGFTRTMSAPSATSRATSRSASRPLAGSCW